MLEGRGSREEGDKGDNKLVGKNELDTPALETYAPSPLLKF